MTDNRILIVEDEFIVALNLRQIMSNMGFDVIGIAPDAATAEQLAQRKPDIALVDLNLRDGPTGPEIGARLSQKYGTTVLFLTANASQLRDGIKGTIGVLSKPVDEQAIGTVLDFLVKHRVGEPASPPPSLRLFPSTLN
ncbi:MAG TPA: response regulator [Sphingorhabdus lacus]|jgi:DNA-binding response OmpR family regulator|nr:response regulator [Sphingorhabdus lacus]HPV68195.1 response regulator [Sphingorhabdus lacus]